MTHREILIRCPGCGIPKQVSIAVGQQLNCDVCGTRFYAPIVDPDHADGRPESEPQVHSSPSEISGPKGEAERLRLILGKLMALKDAESKIEKSKADIEKEAREALGGKAPTPPQKPIDPFSKWEAEMFGGYRPPWKGNGF